MGVSRNQGTRYIPDNGILLISTGNGIFKQRPCSSSRCAVSSVGESVRVNVPNKNYVLGSWVLVLEVSELYDHGVLILLGR